MGRTDQPHRRGQALHHPPRTAHRQRGLSLVELMISLAISATLLVATMVALDVSFRAYAIAAEQASSQATTRMIINRLLTLVRTSTAHGPLLPDDAAVPPITLAGNVISSNFLQLINPNGELITVTYNAADQQLDLTIDTGDGTPPQTFPILGGVTDAQFSLTRRLDDDGILVLDRGTMDFTVEAGADATIAIENKDTPPIRVIASTKPRKIP